MQSEPCNKTLLGAFPVFISYGFSDKTQRELRKAVNLHFLGDIDCNARGDDGRFTPKYPEKETEEFKECSWRISCGYQSYIMVNFYSDGSSEILGEADFGNGENFEKLAKQWL
jgi:hypothetical protein